MIFHDLKKGFAWHKKFEKFSNKIQFHIFFFLSRIQFIIKKFFGLCKRDLKELINNKNAIHFKYPKKLCLNIFY